MKIRYNEESGYYAIDFENTKDVEQIIGLKEVFSLLQLMAKTEGYAVRKYFDKAIKTRIFNKVKAQENKGDMYYFEYDTAKIIEKYVYRALKTFEKYNMITFGTQRQRKGRHVYRYNSIDLTEKGKGVQL